MQITVEGRHTESVPPELASVHLRVEQEGTNRDAVLGHVTDVINRLTAALKAEGDVGTITTLRILPVSTSSWTPTNEQGKPFAPRYTARGRARATFSDFAALSSFMDTWGRDDVELDQVEWELTDERRRSLEDDVLGRAVEAAEARARTMALAAGAGDVRFVELADQGLLAEARDEMLAGGYGAARQMMSKSSGVELHPEDIDVTATVHARFETTV